MSKRRLNINPEDLLGLPGDLWVYWKDPQGRYLACNDLMAAAIQLNSRYDIIGKTDFDFPLLKSEAQFYRNADNQVIKNKMAMQFTETATLPDATIQFMTLKNPVIYESDKTELFGLSYYLKQNNHHSLELLTPREQQILQLMISGKTAKNIATLLHRSKRTIEHHIDNIKNKFNVTSKYELLLKSIDFKNRY